MTAEHIVLFDGVCNLCNRSVNFIIRHDKKDLFRFVSLQSESASRLLGDKYPRSGKFETLFYWQEGKIHEQSGAVLLIMKKLGFPFSLLYMLIVIPPFIRNYFYALISRNRYNWFGRKDECMVPAPEVKEKFL